MTETEDGRESRVLLFGLLGGDVSITQGILADSQITTEVCADLEALSAALAEGAAAVIIAEEALVPQVTDRLLLALAAQPPWSDLPILVVTSARTRFALVEGLKAAANVTLLERPVRIRTMVNAAAGALRARRRQYYARDLLRQSEAASRSKDDFLATVSHELRTPINAVLGWAYLARTEALDPVKRDRAISAIERNAWSLARLIEDVLDVSRITSGAMRLDLQFVDMPRVLDAALEAVRPAIEAKHLVLELSVDRQVGAVDGDPGRLRQVLWNLLANAAKFTPAGGRIRVALTGLGSQIEITVSDTGQGIRPEFLPHVFERFRQQDQSSTRAQGGLGLGLAIAKQIVELHGGRITVSSEGEGRGATFSVTLPVLNAEVRAGNGRAAAPAPGMTEHPAELEKLRVLVVEDEVDARDLLVTLLEQCGSVVTAVGSSEDAIHAIETAPPDVIVSDIRMPGEDGYTFIKRVRGSGGAAAGIPAAAMSAYAGPEGERRSLRAGYQAHLSKPLEPGKLVAVIADLARGARP